MKRNKEEQYRIILNFLLPVLLAVSVAVLFSGTQYAGDKAHFQITGEEYERIYFEEVKNSCIYFFDMIK